VTTTELLSHFDAVKKTGTGWRARCPAHDDGTASLSISEGKKGSVIFCHAGCPTDTVLAKKGLKLPDLFSDTGNGKPAPRLAKASYDYQDADAKLLFQVVRFEPKDFRQRRPDGKGGWIWDTKGITKVLYRLPETIRDVARGLPIMVSEGEKDVHALVKRGFSATCNPGGAGKWLGSYSGVLLGADVIIIPDRDEPGMKQAQDVAAKLQGIAKRVRVLELADSNHTEKPIKDISDFFDAGGTAENLIALVDAAPEWKPSKVCGQDFPKSQAEKFPAEYLPSEAESLADLKSGPPIVTGKNSLTADAGKNPPIARPLSALVHHVSSDPNELLLFRFLCRCAGLLLCGPTGIGKSSLAFQLAILWALARECFGIKPVRALKSLIVQAENDDGDQAEIRDGIYTGLGLTPDERDRAGASVIVAREDQRTGPVFLADTVRPLLSEHKPDLLWIDPALSYLGGEANSQRDVGGFLRNGLNPLLREFGCGCIVVTHTNKPATGKEKSQWTAGDFAYLGTGSAEWANWARGVLALRSIGSREVFELQAGKRGGRLGWREADGETKAFVKYLAHAREPGVICWLGIRPGIT